MYSFLLNVYYHIEDVEEANIITQVIDEADIDPELGEEAAKIIQHAFRMFKVRRQKVKCMKI